MTNTRNLANLAAVLDDASSGQVLTSTGSGGVTFAAASGGGGGSMTVYNDLNGTDDTPSGYTYLTNASSPSNGDLAFVTANNTVYVRASSGWRKIATIQESPGTITGHSASYPSIGQNATTDITLSSTDPEGFDVTWSYTVGGNGTLSGSNINNSNGDTLASIAVQTANANSGGTNTITYRITRETTSVAGDFTITFTATDSQSTGTSDTGAISFELVFIVADSNYTTLLMTTDGSQGDNSDITDSSSSNHTITVNGDARAGTFSPYRHGGYSTYFDASEDYLSLSASDTWGFGNGAWTVEFWINTTDTDFDPVSAFDPSSPFTGWGIRIQSGLVKLFVSDGSSSDGFDTVSGTTTVNDGSWHHVALTSGSGSNAVSCYVDGTLAGSHTFTVSISSTGQALRVGADTNTTIQRPLNGYMSDVRIVKGTAITPASGGPIERLTAVTNTSLLTCHLPYISDGSSNGHSITVNGDIEAKPFGPYDYDQYSKSVNGGSIHFDGLDAATGDYLTVYDTGLSVGNNSAFTVEFWFLTKKNPDSLQNIWNTYSTSTASMTDEQLKFAYSNQNTGAIYLYDRQNSGNILEVTNKKLGRNTWNHFCWTRDASNNHKFYINGEQIGTSTSSTSYDTNRMAFGVREYNTANAPLDGNISDFRLVKGTVVYSGEFTPPTGPLTTTGGTYSDTTNVNTSITSGHTKLLISGTDAHVIDKSQVSNLKLGGTAAAVTNAPNNSNISSTNAVSLDGDSDYVQLPVGSLDLGSSDFTLEAWIYQDTNAGSGSSSHTIYSDWLNTNNNKSSLFRVTDSSGQKVQFLYSTDGSASTNYTSTATISNSTWTHVAVCKDSTSLRFYKDGAREVWASSPSFTLNPNDGTVGPLIGSNYDGAGVSYTQFFDGYIQDFRVTKGKARYTAADESSNIPSAPLSA